MLSPAEDDPGAILPSNLDGDAMNDAEGLWTIEGETMMGSSGAGIIVLNDGRMLGGGAKFFWVGGYSIDNRKFIADARCFHFHGPATSAFGDSAPDFRLKMRGTCSGDRIDGDVERSDLAGRKLRFQMIRRAGFDPKERVNFT